jgi:iron(III) transport system substrate-binding protein
MFDNRKARALLGAGAVWLLSATAAVAQTFPSPTDEAKLYELARKEGKIVWYEAAPIEPMQQLVSRFSKKYPGINVQLLRITGPQQYQKFMQERATAIGSRGSRADHGG